MNPAAKRFAQRYQPVADAISRLDVDQELRERIASDVTEAFASVGGNEGDSAQTRKWAEDFSPSLFRLIASDPLCPCAGPSPTNFAEPCPEGREIRVAMHLSSAPDGRSEAWRRTRPVVRCVTCGARVYVPGYAEATAGA